MVNLPYVETQTPLQNFLVAKQGAEETGRRNFLADVGRTAANEGFGQGALHALRGGETDLAMKLQSYDAERKLALAEQLFNAASEADTPERWTAMVDGLESTFGRGSVPEGFRDFRSRESAIALSLTAYERANLQLAQEREARQAQMDSLRAQSIRQGMSERSAARQSAVSQRQATAQFLVDRGVVPDMEQALVAVDAGMADDLFKQAGESPRATTTLGKLRQDLDAGLISPEQYDAAVAKETTPRNGITVSPDGTVQIGGTPLSTTGANRVQQKQVNAAELGARVSAIRDSYKPEYQTIGRRITSLINSGRAKLDPNSLSGEERTALSDYATFRSEAINNINRVLNELSGAAVSPQEAERLRAAMPDPGTGVFDGDDPVSFEAKMNRVLAEVDRALVRYQFYQEQGLPGSMEDLPLGNIRKIDGVWMIERNGEIFRIGGGE